MRGIKARMLTLPFAVTWCLAVLIALMLQEVVRGESNNLHLNMDENQKERSELRQIRAADFGLNSDSDSDSVSVGDNESIKGFFDKLFNRKNKTKQDGDEPMFAELDDNPTGSTLGAIRSTTQFSTIKQTNSNSLPSDDAFYRLKMHCLRTYDDLCTTKRLEMFDLVKKCQKLRADPFSKQHETCREVFSIYCYVYFSRDLSTCFSADYDLYVPGKKFTPAPGFSTSTASTRVISINIITPPPRPSPFTPPRPPPFTPSPWPTPNATPQRTQPRVTTPTTTTTTTRSTTTTSRATPSRPPVTTPGSNKLANPFNGPITTIPTDPEKLKQIGQYCLRIKQKEPNCDKALLLLKNKFKVCEKTPKTDVDCQSFKVNFCTAFETFPCCPDVLAGRTCTGKSNSLRKRAFYMV